MASLEDFLKIPWKSSDSPVVSCMITCGDLGFPCFLIFLCTYSMLIVTMMTMGM